MKDYSGFMVITVIVVSMISGCTVQDQNRVKTGGPEKVDFRVLPFNLTDVKLLEGPFLKATQLNRKTLLAYKPDNLKFQSHPNNTAGPVFGVRTIKP